MSSHSDNGYKQNENCWNKKSGLEKVLILITIVSIIFSVICVALLLLKSFINRDDSCANQQCVIESAKILQFVDKDINPCDDFYHFVCNNFIRNAHGDENLFPIKAVFRKRQKKLIELYWEPIQENDHKMVKSEKKLFRSCMNETEIEKDNLLTITDALTIAGGWPVIEGTHWNQANFDWIKASSILRRLGYFYSVFLEVRALSDPNDSNKNILMVSLPTTLWDYSSRDFDNVDVMTNIAARFGSRNKQIARIDMGDVNKFLLQLQLEAHSHPATTFKKYTVEEYQKFFNSDSIDWLHFINSIVGPKVLISKTDQVLFQSPESYKNWLTLINRTPKKTQANYFMWKVVESSLPFLIRDLRLYQKVKTGSENREEFCLNLVGNAISIIYNRRYLPPERKKKVEELGNEVKLELISQLKDKKWFGKSEETKIRSIPIIELGDYFNDNLLDDLDVDMIDTKTDSFLNLLGQHNRNYQTKRYKDTRKFTNNVNANYISASATEDYYFDEKRPYYLNFANLGTLMAQYLIDALFRDFRYYISFQTNSNKTEHIVDNFIKCLLEEQKDNMTSWKTEVALHTSKIILADHLAKATYERWIQNHEKEQKLIGVDYTTQQLFWISTVIGTCHPVKLTTSTSNKFNISEVVKNSEIFNNDFNCPSNFKLNSSNRCYNIFW